MIREALEPDALARAGNSSIQRTVQALEAVYGDLLPVGG